MSEQEEVRRILADFESRIVDILDRAWDGWVSLSKPSYVSARTRASWVFDFIKHHAIAEFDGDPNIHAIPEGQTIKFLFHDIVLVRFKKANSKGIGSNIETQTVLQFVDPRPHIPNLLPDIYKIEICYHLNATATEMETISVTKRERRRKVWSYPIERGEPGNIALFPPRPAGPGDNSPPEVRPRKSVDAPAEKPSDKTK